jgi:hypothetical protein
MIDGHGVGNINKNVRDRRSIGITRTLCGQGRCGAQSDTASNAASVSVCYCKVHPPYEIGYDIPRVGNRTEANVPMQTKCPVCIIL